MKNISLALKAQFNLRIYDECIPRIIKVLGFLTHEQIWYIPNKSANSIGHLILHLCGNVTQWIGSGIGSLEDNRKRDLEFSSTDSFSAKELGLKLQNLKQITDITLSQVNNNSLLNSCEVQGYDETELSILIHVIEHFSYHTGQIAIIAKYQIDKDLGFYEGQNLNAKSVK